MVQNLRHIDGREQHTWDLPGGQVESGELLHETLARELTEETGLSMQGSPEFLFVQEGEKRHGGRRQYAWRSFFFGIEAPGEPSASGEVLDLLWMDPEQLGRSLHAPYHDSFLSWLARGGQHFLSVWDD